jgi:predicted ATP-grasp superfamily ATP-dependent carboligase
MSCATAADVPTAVVTDADRGSGVAIIRSLGRRGWRVVAASAHRWPMGGYSRFTTARVRYPDPAARAGEMVEVLVDQARRHGADLVVPVTDEVLLPLASARERFRPGTLAIPDDDALAVAGSKSATTALAGRLGIPVPRTAEVTDVEEGVRFGEEVGFPVVVKPVGSVTLSPDGSSTRHLEVSYASDAIELRRRLRDAAADGRSVLVQQKVAGEGHGVEVLCHDGRPLAAFQHRRLREVPVTGGASSFRESVALDPVLAAHSFDLLAELRWTGLAMVEFKVAGEERWLMEINGRIWGSLPLAVRAGLDFPAKLADLHQDGPPPPGPPDTTYELAVRSRDLRREVIWIGSVLRRGGPGLRRRDAVATALRLAVPSDGYDVLSRSDPLPGLLEIGSVVRHLVGKAGRHAPS